jgi:hypothetical protein
MDTIIYTASPLRAFSGLIFLTAFFFVLGLVGALTGILGRRDHILKRLGAGCAGSILLLAGVVMVITTYRSYQTGEKTVVMRVEEKNEVVRNCDSPGGTCTDYVVEGNTGGIYYTFNVGEGTWNRMEVGGCYQFTYYPPKSLLGEYLQDPAYAGTYESGAAFTRIERVDCP